MHRLFFRIYIDSPEVPGLKLMAFNACDDGGVSP